LALDNGVPPKTSHLIGCQSAPQAEQSVVVATASVKDLDGSLDELIDSFGRDVFHRDTGGLDGPVWWTFPDQDETDDDQLAMDRASQEVFEAVLERAARVPPGSVRQLAMLMADLGVFERELSAVSRGGGHLRRYRLSRSGFPSLNGSPPKRISVGGGPYTRARHRRSSAT
jgi:hypothetical protein